MSKKAMTAEDRLVSRDRMRFVKNSTCSNLCYLAILFNLFYFVLLYRQNPDYFYTIQIGGSIVYNLVFMLLVFLASEAVKNYNKNYSFLLCVIGVMQVVRIFAIPTSARNFIPEGAEAAVITNAVYLRMVIYLLVSAAALIASSVINYIKCTTLEAHVKSLEKNA